MNEAEFKADLRSYWIDNWSDPRQVLWADDENQGEVDTYWLRITIRSEGSQSMIVGRGREEHRGLIMIEVYGPRKDGPGELERFASEIANFWRLFRHERIKADVPSVIGPTTDGAFNRHLITLGWRGDMRN